MGTPKLDGVESIKLARTLGFDGIDLRVSDHLGEITPKPSKEELSNIRNSLDGEGIEIVSLFAYNERGNDAPESWSQMEESLLAHLDIADSLGCPAVRMFGGDPQKAKSADEHIEKTAMVIQNIFERHRTDVQIRLQNHLGSFLFTQGRKLYDLVGNPRFNQVFSPDHSYLMNENFEEILPIVKESSGQIFISDVSKNDSKKGHVRTEIGEGEVPLIDSIKALGSDFNGFLTLKWEKIWNDYLAEPEDAFPRFLSWMKENGFR